MTKKASTVALEDSAILGALRLFRFLVRVLPYRVSLAIGARMGDLAYTLSARRGVMLKNLRSVYAAEKSPAELARIARESFRNLGRSGIELLRAPDMNRAFIEKSVKIVGQSKVDAALKEGKGILFLTGHFGSWEMLNISSGLLGYPMTALAREQKHPRSDAYLNDLRRSTGNQVIYKGMPVREILRALKLGRIVGILSDQDGGRGGTFVPFFGRQSSYPKGVAAFALRTGAPIFPTFIFRETEGRHRIEVEGPLRAPEENLTDEEKEKALLSQFASILEAKVRKDPTQWLWAHRRWKSTPDRFVVILSDGKAGHRNQSQALYEAIQRQREEGGAPEGATHLKLIEVKFKNKASEKIFKTLCRFSAGSVSWTRILAKKFLTQDSYREIMSTYADIVISAGSSVAGVNLWCAAENAGKPVVIMDPGFAADKFHAVIAPRHDRVAKRENVFETRGALTRVSGDALDREAGQLRQKLGLESKSKVIGVLIGGDTAGIRFESAVLSRALDEIRRVSGEAPALVVVTTSRRTPAWAEAALKERFAGVDRCPLLIIANEANPPGVVQGILGLSDAVVVTGESISMVSEAVSSGKKVIVIEPYKISSLKSKHRDFLNLMEADGLLTRTLPEDLYASLRAGLAAAPATGASFKNDEQVLREAAQKIAR